MVITLGEMFKVFFTDVRTQTLVGLILLNFVLGVTQALRNGTFDWRRVADFYWKQVLPYVFGYFCLYWFGAFGLIGLTGDFGTEMIITALLAPVVATLAFNIKENLQAIMSANVKSTDQEVLLIDDDEGILMQPNDDSDKPL